MAEVQEIEMAGERAEAVINIDHMISEAENSGTEETKQDKLQTFMQLRLNAVPGEPLSFRPITIFRVPAWFHEVDKKLFEPRVVSVGPYHHGKEEFRAMEELKWSFLRDFMSRNSKVGGLAVYLEQIRPLEAQARMCYSEIVNMTSDEFVMMLILDGTFILEYLTKFEYSELGSHLRTGWVPAGVASDLFLLENQIPFFVIHKLFATNGDHGDDRASHHLLLERISDFLPKFAQKQILNPPKASDPFMDIDHLLHVYHMCLVPELEDKWGGDTDDEQGESFAIIPCASELSEAGVTFQRKKEPDHMFDITFKNGVMEIPLIMIDSIKTIAFCNLVAFEQSQQNKLRGTFTSYLAVMDALINTKNDISLLQECGILENLLRNEENAADFFNLFGDFYSVDHEDHHFFGLFEKVKKYSDSTWHRHRARLMHDYFKNPWTIISLVAGGVLLVLTFLQTVYTILK